LEDAARQEERNYALTGKLGVDRVDAANMSGGEETRLKLAQALANEAHGIFADEPTSHLDREGIAFLTDQLSAYSGAIIVISHDRYFLDQVVDKIWELHEGKITEYWGVQAIKKRWAASRKSFITRLKIWSIGLKSLAT